ncbi:hypothetical protein [Cryobacterium tepidiphilum]|uniref:LPXTG cell wall anchor domain-containing protein n=1 Tax=Cryobacterium tepidiphilum TaxID=2486026 RepID=A0A3M8L0Y1_9MICO|nr:hypothetical protein [Cryobacterium tepidiphilum]RNE59200.1 hypothetical protein EEJ31_10545 [Cryobacterium tepidiphilum]
MTRIQSLQKLLAVPVAVLLALAGALAAAGPANAATPLVVNAPPDGASVDSRTVQFEGTGTPAGVVKIVSDDTDDLAARTTVQPDGRWATPVTFAWDAPEVQHLVIMEGAPGEEIVQATRTITLPAVDPADAPLVVQSPAEGDVVPSRTVTFSGTGLAGAIINLLGSDDTPLTEQTLVGEDGRWSATVSFARDADVQQAVRVVQELGAGDVTSVTRTITLPPPSLIKLESPTDGQTLTSRSFDVTGEAPAGAHVTVADLGGAPLGQADLAEGETRFVIPVRFADTADRGQGIVVSGQHDGQDLNEVTVHIALPPVEEPTPTETPTPAPQPTPKPTPKPTEPPMPTEPPAPPVQHPEPGIPQLIAAPVITSPVAGARITDGSTVTFAGFGVPGTNIAVAVVPTSVLDLSSAPAGVQQSTGGQRMTRNTQANAAQPIVVDSDGFWSVRLSLPDGEYTVTAVHVRLDAAGMATAALSEPSAPVTFRVAATPAPGSGIIPPTQTPAATPTATSRPATDTEALAATGIDGHGALTVGMIFALAGGGILLLRRRHAPR